MFGKSGKLSQISAWILLIVNFIVMVCCTLAFGFSLWVIASPSSLSGILKATGGPTLFALLPPQVLTVNLGVGVSAVTVIIFFISFMGFYGAITRSAFLLFMYATLTFLMLLLECSLIFYFSTSFIEKGLQESDGQWNHLLRVAFQCCELNKTDADTSRPWSCCGTAGYTGNCTAAQTYKEDCNTVITDWIYRYQTVIYACLTVLHIILSTCSLLRRSRSPLSSDS